MEAPHGNGSSGDAHEDVHEDRGGEQQQEARIGEASSDLDLHALAAEAAEALAEGDALLRESLHWGLHWGGELALGSALGWRACTANTLGTNRYLPLPQGSPTLPLPYPYPTKGHD